MTLVLATPLVALNPSLPVNKYLHTRWTQEEGSAPPIRANPGREAQMEGLSRDWTCAGTRRNVVYASPPRGRYQFHVRACRNHNVRNNAGAVLRLRIEPYFYRTIWFYLAMVALLAFIAWGIHWLQVRRVIGRFRLVARERARLMRELHDSFLQKLAGLVYQLEAVARQFDTAPQAGKERLEKAIEQAEEALQEARKTIQNMRLPALENGTLPKALAEAGRDLTEGHSVAFRLSVKGPVRMPSYDIQAHIYLVAREAIANAVNHANAIRIDVELTYTDKAIRLMVRDDGVGFDPAASPPKAGHWGLQNMQDRADEMGATFRLDTAPGRGTTITVEKAISGPRSAFGRRGGPL